MTPAYRDAFFSSLNNHLMRGDSPEQALHGAVRTLIAVYYPEHPDFLHKVLNKPAIGLYKNDYVFVTRWPGCDWNDPWAVGPIEDTGGACVKVNGRWWSYAMNVTHEQGAAIIKEYTPREGSDFDPRVLKAIIEG